MQNARRAGVRAGERAAFSSGESARRRLPDLVRTASDIGLSSAIFDGSLRIASRLTDTPMPSHHCVCVVHRPRTLTIWRAVTFSSPRSSRFGARANLRSAPSALAKTAARPAVWSCGGVSCGANALPARTIDNMRLL